MKKLVFALALAIICKSSFAQGKPSFGLRAGINISNVSVSGDGVSVSLSSITGFTGGVFAELPVSPLVSIQPELNYSMLGAKVKGSFETEQGTLNDVKLKTNYLTIPVLVKVKVPNTGLGVYAGPQYGFLLSATASAGSQSGSNKDSYNSGDFAGIFGAEYFFSHNVGLSARYQLGFSNIAKEAGDGESMKNKAFSFTLAFKL